MQASAQVDRTEASAQTAFEQLLEEEQQLLEEGKQAAAKAATKKAKKLRQKAKKQQDQQPQSPSENEASPIDGISQAPDKLLQHHSEADEMTEGSRNMPAVFTADGDAANTAALLDPASPTGHDRIASSLSALTVCDSLQGEELEAMQEDPDPGHDHAATGQAATAPGQDAVGLDSDAHRLQNIFCCPITKVVPVLLYIQHASQRFAAAPCRFTACHQALTQSIRTSQFILLQQQAMLMVSAQNAR